MGSSDVYLDMIAVVFSFYVFLMITERKNYLSNLTAGFGLYLITITLYIFRDTFIDITNEVLFLVFLKSGFFTAPFLIQHAVSEFVERKNKRFWLVMILLAVSWISVSEYTNLHFNLQLVPLLLINSIVYTYIAFDLYTYRKVSIGARSLAATLFVASAIVFLIVPFFQKSDTFVFIGEVINHMALIIIALMIAMIMLYFQKVRFKLQEQQLTIDYMNYHDELTGLYNRQYFDEQKENLDADDNYPLSVVIADVSGLTLINDKLGTSLGNLLLIEASKLFQTMKKANELVFRWGGEEILIMMLNTDFNNAKERVSELYKQIGGDGVKNLPVSLSFGIATKNSYNQKLDMLIEEAENAMYVNKLINHKVFRKSLAIYFSNKIHEKEGKTKERLMFIKKASVNIGFKMGIEEIEIDVVEQLSQLYDVGKIIIPTDILLKKEKLSDEDWEIIKSYPDYSYQIISSAYEGSLLAESVYSMRERFDGTGYPRQLKGNEIPVAARILSVIEGYDAMTNSKYRDEKDPLFALKEIKKNSGTQFDPEVVSWFVKMMEEKQQLILTRD